MKGIYLHTAILLAVLPRFAVAQTRTVGLLLHDEKRAAAGYTLVAPKHYTRTYLIDNSGRVVKTWDSCYEPGQSAHLLPNGHLLRAAMVQVPGGGTGGGEGGRIEEYDWDGNLIWEFDYATQNYSLHHDIKPLPNGNVIALMVERKSKEQAIAAGLKPDLLQDPYVLPDAVVEIEPVRPRGGRIVWEWHVWDHMVQNYDQSRANYGSPSAHPELIDPNALNRRIPAFWNHMNSIDYNPTFDQIILSVRGNSEAWVIDHSTTTAQAATHAGGKSGKGGDLLYRWGNPQMYGAGTASAQTLFEQHDVQWIEAGRPGAGNLLVFNNGLGRPSGPASGVDEWVPPVSGDGTYSKASTGTLWGPTAPTWTFLGEYATKYFEEAISGAQRLPNGNTLICYGTHGVLVEITPQKETVWQYINPVVREGPLWQGQSAKLDDRGHQYNAVFKVRRYPPDYAGLAGKDLTPGRVIELSGVRAMNGASFREDPGAPGALLTIASDETLSDGTDQPSGSTLPVRLAGTAVEITDSKGQTQQCPLYYVSPRQINAVLPESCARGQSTITVRRDSGGTKSVSLTVDQVAPGLFTLDGTVGAVQALRVDGSGRRTDVPVYRYDDSKKAFSLVPIDLGPASDQIYLSLYATGVRGSDSQRVSASVGGEPVAVLGVAAQPQYPGLDQINIGPLPRTLAGHGTAQIAFTTDGRQSNPVAVSIR